MDFFSFLKKYLGLNKFINSILSDVFLERGAEKNRKIKIPHQRGNNYAIT